MAMLTAYLAFHPWHILQWYKHCRHVPVILRGYLWHQDAASLHEEYPGLCPVDITTDCYLYVPYQEVQDGAAKIVAIAWSHNNMKLAVCTADRGKGDRAGTGKWQQGKGEGGPLQIF